MDKPTILVVDDEPMLLDLISKALKSTNYKVLTADSAEEGMALLEINDLDMVISDYKMPGGMSGIDFLKHVSSTYPEVLTILLTGHASLETAMDAINSAGVYKFITKPFDLNELMLTIKRALEVQDLIKEKNLLTNKLKAYEAHLDDLEKKHPGITHVIRDKDGHIITGI